MTMTMAMTAMTTMATTTGGEGASGGAEALAGLMATSRPAGEGEDAGKTSPEGGPALFAGLLATACAALVVVPQRATETPKQAAPATEASGSASTPVMSATETPAAGAPPEGQVSPAPAMVSAPTQPPVATTAAGTTGNEAGTETGGEPERSASQPELPQGQPVVQAEAERPVTAMAVRPEPAASDRKTEDAAMMAQETGTTAGGAEVVPRGPVVVPREARGAAREAQVVRVSGVTARTAAPEAAKTATPEATATATGQAEAPAGAPAAAETETADSAGKPVVEATGRLPVAAGKAVAAQGAAAAEPAVTARAAPATVDTPDTAPARTQGAPLQDERMTGIRQQEDSQTASAGAPQAAARPADGVAAAAVSEPALEAKGRQSPAAAPDGRRETQTAGTGSADANEAPAPGEKKPGGELGREGDPGERPRPDLNLPEGAGRATEAKTREDAEAEPARAFTRLELKELPQFVRRAELVARAGGPTEMRVQLVPENLGRLSVRVSVSEGSVTARLVVETLEVKALVQERLPELERALREQGLRLNGLSVGCEGAGTRDGNFPREPETAWDGRSLSYGNARRDYEERPVGLTPPVPAGVSHLWTGRGGVLDALM